MANSNQSHMIPQTATRPDPDPTVLTTQSLLREIASLKELFDAKLRSLEKEVDDIHINVHSLPAQRTAEIGHLEKFMEEKLQTIREKFLERFASIDKQFVERDERTEQVARDSKVAVDAAFAAQKEAVSEQNKAASTSINKSEASTGKQIDQLGELIKQNTAGLTDKIDDMKERMNRYEGLTTGAHEASVSRRATTTSTTQVVGVIAAIVLGLLSLAVTLSHTPSALLTH